MARAIELQVRQMDGSSSHESTRHPASKALKVKVSRTSQRGIEAAQRTLRRTKLQSLQLLQREREMRDLNEDSFAALGVSLVLFGVCLLVMQTAVFVVLRRFV